MEKNEASEKAVQEALPDNTQTYPQSQKTYESRRLQLTFLYCTWCRNLYCIADFTDSRYCR